MAYNQDISISDFIAELAFGDPRGWSREIYPVYPKHEFYIGREDVNKMIGTNDLAISNRHISIRCVQFDEDATWGVPPIVYVENLSPNSSYIQRYCNDNPEPEIPQREELDCVKGYVPLADGDRVYLNNDSGIFVHFRCQVTSNRQPLNSVMEREIETFRDSYHVNPQIIGIGGQGTVYVARQQCTERQLACKVIPVYGAAIMQSQTSNITSDSTTLTDECLPSGSIRALRQLVSSSSLTSEIVKLKTEYSILKNLDHPNIITLEQVFITTHHIYIMEELITGGDLLSFMEHKRSQLLGDAQSAVIILQVLKAVEYLHDHGIVHRDIKPDNILMTSWKGKARVVLTDFGHAKIALYGNYPREPRRMFTTVGTLGYTAPEVHRQNMTIPPAQGYSISVDMWSIGTIAALLLTGNSIFAGDQDDNDWESRQSKLRAAAECDLSVIDRNEGSWFHVGRRGKAFVKALLVLDERIRLTAKSALKHRWINNPVYAAELKSIYKDVTASWKPRAPSADLVRFIDTSHIQSSTTFAPSQMEPTHLVQSRHCARTRASSLVPSSHRQHSGSFSGSAEHYQGDRIGIDTYSQGLLRDDSTFQVEDFQQAPDSDSVDMDVLKASSDKNCVLLKSILCSLKGNCGG